MSRDLSHDKPLGRAEVEQLLKEAGRSGLLNLSGRNLAGIDLSDFDLSGATLTDANLKEAELSRVKLNKANLRGAQLHGANLTEAKMMNVRLTNVDLSDSKLKGANLVTGFLGEADLSGADLREAMLIGTNLPNARLRGADLQAANLRGANLSKADLIGANLQDTNLALADLQSADLNKADLSNADLQGANLSLANLGHAKLHGANLAGANLNGTLLGEADLQGVDLSKVDLERAILRGANLTGAQLTESQKETLEDHGIVGLDRIIEVQAVTKTEPKQAGGDGAFAVRIRVSEQPVTAHTFTAGLAAITELHLKCWLIAKGRSTDLIGYTQNRTFQLPPEANLLIGSLSFNPAVEIELKAETNPKGVAEAMIVALDSIAQTPPKTAESKRMSYALETADKMVSNLQAEADIQTRSMLSQFLLPELLQLGEAKGIERVTETVKN